MAQEVETIFNDYEEKINALNKMLDENAEKPGTHEDYVLAEAMRDLIKIHNLYVNKFKAVFHKYVNR